MPKKLKKQEKNSKKGMLNMQITQNTIVICWDDTLLISNVMEVIVGETYNIIDFRRDYQGQGKITEYDYDNDFVAYEEVK